MIQRPRNDLILIKRVFPSFDEIEFINAGAQRLVYKIKDKGAVWVLKLVQLKQGNQDESEGKGVQRQIEGRLERELRIQREARTVNTMVHLGPHPVKRVLLAKLPYFSYTEQYLDGNDLRALIRDNVKPSFNELANLTLHILEAIGFLWQKRCVHRDIKPGNIMRIRGRKARYVLLDIGYALALSEDSLTKNGLIPGTLKYMSPEQLDVKRKRSLDLRSDIYSLGITVLEYACRRHPYIQDGDTTTNITRAILYTRCPTLKSQRNDLSSDFCSLVDTFVNKQPHLRPVRIGQVRQEISNLVKTHRR